MNFLLSCPKCKKSLEVAATLAGSQSECPDCGQWFIVGEAGARLPVVQPQALVEGRKGPFAGQTAGTFATSAGTGSRRRRCAACGSSMSITHGESHVLDFLLPLGHTVFWVCERCGKEIKVQSPWRIFLMALASPLLVVWWIVFTESSRHHGADAAWWQKAVEEFAPHDSKGSFWYILFLFLFPSRPWR